MIKALSPALWRNHPRFGKYFALVHEDLSAIYSRDIQKWLLVAPLIGVAAGLVSSGIVVAILDTTWAYLLPRYYAHHWLIVPATMLGFLLTGLIMQNFTDNPNLHCTDEIIRSYHQHEGDINIGQFGFKLLASLTTIGFGGSAALEGPGIYGGGAIGSWLWTRLTRFEAVRGDRRVMLISGAAAGMAAVFRTPVTGLIFALEMPYRDDLAHEAILPSLIASVVAYATLVAMVGSEPLFGFVGQRKFAEIDLVWAAILGLICGLAGMAFAITYRRFRTFSIKLPMPHSLKLLAGGLGTGLCGLLFVSIFTQPLMPLGPNYGAMREILIRPHSTQVLVGFIVLKAAATIFTLGVGGVCAMFMPTLILGGAIGNVFGQSVVHASTVDLYVAIGMASFLAADYKTPLAAVVFVVESTGGRGFIIPALIGAAVAYAVSGEASVSAEQRLHEIVKLSQPTGIKVRQIMRTQIVGVNESATLKQFVDSVTAHTDHHPVYPVFRDKKAVGIISLWEVGQVPPEKWEHTTVGEVARSEIIRLREDADLGEAVRMLTSERQDQMLLVTGADDAPLGIITHSDVLHALQRSESGNHV